MRGTREREGGARVLVVEDDRDLSQLMAAHLASEGYDVARAREVAAALELVGAGRVDVVVLDLMLPRISGDGLLVRLREREGTRDLPVIVVSAKDAVWTKVDLLRLGADDYLAKPFDLDELTARIEALLRRSRPADGAARVLRHGDLALEPASRRARLAGRDVSLTPAESAVLGALMSAPGRVASKGALARAIGRAGEGPDGGPGRPERRGRDPAGAPRSVPPRASGDDGPLECPQTTGRGRHAGDPGAGGRCARPRRRGRPRPVPAHGRPPGLRGVRRRPGP